MVVTNCSASRAYAGKQMTASAQRARELSCSPGCEQGRNASSRAQQRVDAASGDVQRFLLLAETVSAVSTARRNSV